MKELLELAMLACLAFILFSENKDTLFYIIVFGVFLTSAILYGFLVYIEKRNSSTN